MVKSTRNNRGFTLVEIMLVVALLGIAFSIFYRYMDFNLEFLDRQNSEQDAYLQARTAMSRLTGFMQQYQTFEFNATGDILTAVDADGNPLTIDGKVPAINFGENDADLPGADCKYYYYCPLGNIGQLRSNGSIIADDITISAAALDAGLAVAGAPAAADYVRITIAGYAGGATEQSLTLSAVIRLDRGRPGFF